MGENTKISWADHTFNPWIGCTKVSSGCDNCYAETFEKRVGGPLWGAGEARRRTGPENWRKPIKWNRDALIRGVRARVFCASLADIFDTEVPDAWRGDVFALSRATPALDWLFLTKRHARPREYAGQFGENVRIGFTIEDAAAARMRLPYLAELRRKHGIPTFISYEPALGPVDWSGWFQRLDLGGPGQWLICGAESGNGRRPFNEAWARAARDACQSAGATFFYKQIVRGGKKIELPELDGRPWAEFPNSPAPGYAGLNPAGGLTAA